MEASKAQFTTGNTLDLRKYSGEEQDVKGCQMDFPRSCLSEGLLLFPVSPSKCLLILFSLESVYSVFWNTCHTFMKIPFCNVKCSLA